MGKPWKELEKKAAKELYGVRINRADDYGISDVDVVIPGVEFLRVDCKYRAKQAHHSLIEEIRSKYCGSGEYPVLVTKHRGSHREYVTIDLSLFGALIHELFRLSEGSNEELQDEAGSDGAGEQGPPRIDWDGGGSR